MAYTLGDITLPTPSDFSRRQIVIGRQNNTLDGTTKQDLRKLKEVFILRFKLLTQSQVNDIVGEYSLKTPRNFAVSDGSLSIPSTRVLVRLAERQYNAKSSEYREDIALELTEV